MRPRLLSRVVALDGGTSNTRARLVSEGRVVATAQRSVGVRNTVLSSGGVRTLAEAVRDAVRDVIAEGGGVPPDAVVAAGMLCSEVGLAAVPHVAAPAGAEELAAAAVTRELPDVFHGPILLVPGVKTPAGAGPDGWAEADVMRGEECETIGAAALRPPGGPVAMVWPGSHTKLVEVDAAGRIVRSHTTLAGEITSAVARHTLIAASLPVDLPATPDPSATELGVRLAERDGLGRCAFLVRVAALDGSLSPEQRAAFWIGAVVADDASRLASHPILARAGTVLVGGRQPLRALYAERLAALTGAEVVSLDDDEADHASALGAVEVARRFFGRTGRGLNPG